MSKKSSTHTPPIIRTEQVIRSLQKISPGERILYHRGLDLTTCPDGIGRFAYDLYLLKRANLFQRRVRDCSGLPTPLFEYWAEGK